MSQDAPFRATVLEPIGKLNSYYGVINSAIDKRNHKLLDYDSARAKVKKLVEKPSDDPVRLPRVCTTFTFAASARCPVVSLHGT
jgi:amphiphysin